MPGALLWGYYLTDKKWIPLQVDTNGYVKVDLSNINLDDLADTSFPILFDGDIIYFDFATATWKNKPHVDLTTGVHGVGASTIESTLGSQAKVNTHNALALSHLTHNNDNIFLGYGNESVIDPTTNITIKIPAMTAIADPVSGLDVTDWYGASGAYRQADADSDATHIQDDDASFPTSIAFTLVKWASNAAGTLNTGIGVIITNDSDTLVISKFTGADFAASYYYWIKHSEWVVPVTGYYSCKAVVLYLPAEVDKLFKAKIYQYSGTSLPTQILDNMAPSNLANYTFAVAMGILSLTAGDHVFSVAIHSGTSGTPDIFTSHPSHLPFELFLLKQTA